MDQRRLNGPKTRQLQESQKTTKQRIQQREKELQKLRETVESHKRTAQAAVEDSERIFTELIRSIERSRSEVTQLIRDQEKAAVSRAEGLLEQLEQEIADLRRRDAELEELSHTEDHIHFLQSFQSLSIPPGLTDLSRFTIPPIITFGDVTDLVLLLRENVEDLCRQEMKKISGIVIFLELVSTSEPNTREEFLQYSHQLTLDANTAYEYLCLSEGNRVITESDTAQPCPDHPDRFDSLAQVLCRESMWGCCYWEVEWKGRGVGISVSYKSISRKGRSDNCAFGYNNQSWSLYCFPTSYSKYSFWHNHIETELPVISTSSRIGVFLDTIAGTLSFYSISDTMTLIHRVHTTFTQPLYPGFRIYGSLKLCNLAK